MSNLFVLTIFGPTNLNLSFSSLSLLVQRLTAEGMQRPKGRLRYKGHKQSGYGQYVASKIISPGYPSNQTASCCESLYSWSKRQQGFRSYVDRGYVTVQCFHTQIRNGKNEAEPGKI